MAIGDIYQLSCNQSVYGVALANVYHFEQTSDVSFLSDPEDSLMQAFAEDIVPLQAAMSSDDWGTTCLTCRKVRPTGGVRFTQALIVAGDIVNEAIAPNTAFLGSIYSSIAGPRGRGRHWFSGVPKNTQSAGRLDAAQLTLFNAFLDRLIQSISVVIDNADFILRLISSLDAVIRPADSVQARVRIKYLDSRRERIC